MRNRIVSLLFAVLVAGGLTGLAAAVSPAAQAATCTASGDTSHTPDSCGPYTDANILGSGTSGDTNVLNDVWSPPAGFTNALCQTGSATPCQTISATDAEHWTVTANMQSNAGAVQSYPDTQQVYTLPSSGNHPNGSPDPLTNYVNLFSTFTHTSPGSGSGANSYDVGYDIWGGSASAADANWADEIMIWTDQQNRGGCGGNTPDLTNIQFGGTNGVPVQSWDLLNYGSERIWCLHGNETANETSGSVDVYGMLHYLMAPNYTGPGSLPSDFGLNAVEYGVEVCYTSGNYASFSLSRFTLAKGTGSSQQAPAVTTNAATGVTATAATLNGTVNPEAQSTSYHFEYGTSTAYGTSVPVPDGSAGSGSSAVPESANLTGLTAITTYHYRLDATNGTGTTQGADQQFTTSAAGGGSVAFGATAPGSTGAKCANCTSLSWNASVSGTNPALLAEISVGKIGDGSCVVTATDNGAAMTKLSTVHDNGTNYGFHSVYGATAPAASTNTIAFSVAGCGTPVELTGGSLTFTGASQTAPFGTPVTATGSGTAAQAIVSSTSGNMVAGFVSNGSQITSAASPATSRFIANQDNNSGAGNSAGATAPATGSSVTMKWTVASDWWGVTAVQVQHA